MADRAEKCGASTDFASITCGIARLDIVGKLPGHAQAATTARPVTGMFFRSRLLDEACRKA
jgi:hypothetical protein